MEQIYPVLTIEFNTLTAIKHEILYFYKYLKLMQQYVVLYIQLKMSQC